MAPLDVAFRPRAVPVARCPVTRLAVGVPLGTVFVQAVNTLLAPLAVGVHTRVAFIATLAEPVWSVNAFLAPLAVLMVVRALVFIG
jgi:hypothetical protein